MFARTGRWRRGFTLIELLVVIAIIAILVAMLLPAVQQVREAARKSQCQDHLHNIGIALHNYESSYMMLPSHMSAGATAINPGCSSWILSQGFSWRVKILPQMEQKPIYDQIDFTRMGLTGCMTLPPREARGARVDSYLCPSDPTDASVFNTGGYTPTVPVYGTNYAAAVRARADQSHSDARNDDTTKDLGAITRSGITMATFGDGSSNTILVGEVFRGKDFASCGGANSWTPGACTSVINRQRCRDWMESTGFCQVNAGVIVDTSITATAGNPKQYVQRFKINHAKDPNNPTSKVHQDQVNWADSFNGGSPGGRVMSSAHAGGAQACMGDAKVRFISENVDYIALAHAFSADGGEASQLRD